MTGAPPPPPPPPPSPAPSASWGWEPPTGATGSATTAVGSAPETPAPKPRRRWILVLALALGLILVTTVAGTVLFVTRTLPPLSATYDFTNDLHDGNTSSAFAQVCDRLRTPAGRVGFNGFARRVEAADHVSVDILSVDRNGDTATVKFTAEYGANDSTKTTLKLVYEGGDWRPCGSA